MGDARGGDAQQDAEDGGMGSIRGVAPADWPGVWGVIEPVFRRGDTYAISPSITEDAATAIGSRRRRPRSWRSTRAARSWARTTSSRTRGWGRGRVQLRVYRGGEGPGAEGGRRDVHALAAGGGGAALSSHASPTSSFRRTQTALLLWQRHGFEVVGTLPGGLPAPQRGYVDAFVMYSRLKD